MDYQDHHRDSQRASRFVSLLSVDFSGGEVYVVYYGYHQDCQGTLGTVSLISVDFLEVMF